MMHIFLSHNRADLLARCKAKVAQRPHRGATLEQLANGIPLFLDQLERTLAAEESADDAKSLRISGASSGDTQNVSEVGISAHAHGRQLLDLGFTVDQVVHDYGDLCQAITDLAVERDAPFGIAEFRTLNRCLDNAIAGAVTEFSMQREASLARQRDVEAQLRIGSLAHELRNALSSASLAVAALEAGILSVSGATGGVLKRALNTMDHLIRSSIDETRRSAEGNADREVLALDDLIDDAAQACRLYASASGATLTVSSVDPAVHLMVDRERILGALANLLQNAFKFTATGTEVSLRTQVDGNSVRIEVGDHCGGLSAGGIEQMFTPFNQRNADRTGLGLGLSISRQSAEADGGTLTVRDMPGIGCMFTLSLPRHEVVGM